MRFLIITALLAAILTLVTAKPLSFDMDEIQRRWSQGETEVCCPPSAPGCYVFAWIRSLGKKATIHAAESHRDATPAWPILRKDEQTGAFSYATDERTMELRRLKHQKRDTPSRSLLQSFVEKFYRGRGETTMVAKRDVEEAPVLKPRRNYRYQWSA